MSSTWMLSPHITLSNARIDRADGERQQETAAAICERLNVQPGVILADDVGMGKTFVALAVAASAVLQNPSRQVVVMVPSAVGDKWPKDWTVFRENCLTGGREITATESTITRGSDFLKLLDDPADRRKQIIFLSHWALSSNLADPFIKLAVVRAAFRYQRSLANQRDVFPRWAASILKRRDFTEDRVAALMAADPRQWHTIWKRVAGATLDDDPVPASVSEALNKVDLAAVREALATLPLRHSATIDDRLKVVRASLESALGAVWKEALRSVRTHLPLLILDEAHHLKNPNTLRSLFDNGDPGSEDSVRGTFGGVFERMLLLTATPFQLGHRELVSVLRLFGSTRVNQGASAVFDSQLEALGNQLNAAQASAQRLERAWSRLTPDDLAQLPAGWWRQPSGELPEHISTVASFSQTAIERLADASDALRPWVIRHTKVRRRDYRPGTSTLPSAAKSETAGLAIEQGAVLPFLLAARAQAYVSMHGLRSNKKMRALFADGLASSFEAYLATRTGEATVDDREQVEDDAGLEHLDWYLERISASLPTGDASARASHPKIAATVARALHHWRDGEKVLIFCFYRATGRALREHLSTAVAEEIASTARQRFAIEGDSVAEVFEHLADRADSLLRSDRPGGQRLQADVRSIAQQVGLEPADGDALAGVVLRFMRTPAFLVRYVDLNARRGEDAVAETLHAVDGSGLSLGTKLDRFAGRVKGLTVEERASLWDGLLKFRTGSRKVDTLDPDDTAETTPDGVMLLPNVHLANGETDHEFRRRLMTTFNSPFLPEILVASSVMSEGVDLHRECRHIIHHDLDWNPSTLEQRTGRVDRLGSKASLTGLEILVCEPYVGGTQDEKQYVVVKDRERWFGVVMGGRVPEDEWETDRIAERATLPEALLAELTLDLSVWRGHGQ